MLDVLLDALLDSLKILPFLIIVYILIELIESHSNFKKNRILQSRIAPLFGASVGLIPQCGFSVMATNLYSHRNISLGTLMAVYIATSDEAIPILLSNYNKIGLLLPLILIKLVMALFAGFTLDFIMKGLRKNKQISFEETENICINNETSNNDAPSQINHLHNDLSWLDVKTKINSKSSELSRLDIETQLKLEYNGFDNHTNIENDNASNNIDIETHKNHAHDDENEKGCCGHSLNKATNYLLHPLIHSLKVFVYVLIVNLAMGTAIYYLGEEKLQAIMLSSHAFQPFIAGLIGMIPNCASSVLITELYLLGGLNLGSAIAGLSVNAGIAFAVLFKQNKPLKQNFAILFGLYLYSCIIGSFVMLIQQAFFL
ncbi:MAG: putative manganese transporter [Clostridia bacterium]